jgi:hypothetical protein
MGKLVLVLNVNGPWGLRSTPYTHASQPGIHCAPVNVVSHSNIRPVVPPETASRCVDRDCPVTVQARRSETPNRRCSSPTALRRRFGVRSFPQLAP